jgi:ABC-type multidrug transport system fused ATPase/permease subunit
LPIGSDLITAATLLLYVGSASLPFALTLIVGLVPLSVVRACALRQRHALDRRHTPDERMLQYLGDLMTSRAAAAEIRLFGLGGYLMERRAGIFLRLRDDRLRLARARLRSSALSMSGEQLTHALVLAGLVAVVARGSLSVGHFAAFWGAIERFRSALMWLLRSVTVLDADLRYLRDLFEYLDTPEEPGGTREVEPAAVPSVVLDSVSYRYPGSGRPALDDISLQIRPGERIALVGENGAGKTTLARLLLGLYRPTAGAIRVNEADLNEIDPRRWRERTTAVFQDYVRYHLTARENIGFGALERLNDEPAIEAAARASGAAERIARLPAGYETVLGKSYEESGHDLSVGEWQKLALARACLRDAWVIVLDEPTAALDPAAEVEVYRRFRDLAAGRTVLFISHRLGSARLADRVLVLEAGHIVEEGSHADLMGRNGRYARMFSAQASWYR